MSSELAIEVQGVSKRFEIYAQPQDRLKQAIVPRIQKGLGLRPSRYNKEFWALRDISFSVRKGETFGVIGRNGCGKSTLLQVICGTIAPTSGTVRTTGRVAALLELGSGFNPEFTGRENIHLNASILGLKPVEIQERLPSIIAFADIGEFVDQPVKTYSTGMMLRLAFAVVAHVDADILVIDEALSVGDAFFTQKCMRFLRGFMERGTVLFVSHDTPAVVNLCTRAILIEHGTILAQGSPDDISKRYLSSLYGADQDVQGAAVSASNPSAEAPAQEPWQVRDMRSDLLEGSNLRNDIEVFRFEVREGDAFGTGNVQIVNVRLLDPQGRDLSWVVGGRDVTLEIRCMAVRDLLNPIVGFVLKDRLGQSLFADNTYLAYLGGSTKVKAGEVFGARFDFCMPILPAGEYSVSPAVAEGTQEHHVQHQWIHDGLIIRVHASSVCLGLVGIPMRRIRLFVKETEVEP